MHGYRSNKSIHLICFGAEEELVGRSSDDSSTEGPHPEHPLVIPLARDSSRSKGTRRIDAADARTMLQGMQSEQTHSCLKPVETVASISLCP